jgi:hypothetical protein
MVQFLKNRTITKITRILHSAVRERMLLATVLMLLILFCVRSYIHNEETLGMKSNAFRHMKVGWYHNSDMVLAGDSRVLIDLAPREFSDVLSLPRTRNFAFVGGGFSAEYLAAIEDCLDPASSKKQIVLGISPHALTEAAQKNNEFVETRRIQGSLSAWIHCSLEPLTDWLKPVPLLSSLALRLRGRTVPTFDKEYFDDGWLACRLYPEDEAFVFKMAKRNNPFENNCVSPDLQRQLLEQVVTWHRKNITVVAFRPPVHPDIRSLEERYSGYDEDHFVRAFEQAGGHWIEIDQSYRTYDGHHLPRDAAIRFSQDMAQSLSLLLSRSERYVSIGVDSD